MSDTLNDLIARYGVGAVLQALATVMETKGHVTSGIVRDVGAIEEWLEARDLRDRLARVSRAEAKISQDEEDARIDKIARGLPISDEAEFVRRSEGEGDEEGEP